MGCVAGGVKLPPQFPLDPVLMMQNSPEPQEPRPKCAHSGSNILNGSLPEILPSYWCPIDALLPWQMTTVPHLMALSEMSRQVLGSLGAARRRRWRWRGFKDGWGSWGQGYLATVGHNSRHQYAFYSVLQGSGVTGLILCVSRRWYGRRKSHIYLGAWTMKRMESKTHHTAVGFVISAVGCENCKGLNLRLL